MAIKIDVTEYQNLLLEILSELRGIRKDIQSLLAQQMEQKKDLLTPEQVIKHLTPTETILLDKIRELKRITNNEAAEILELSISRANHLLKSLHRKGWLDREYLNRRVYYAFRSEMPEDWRFVKEDNATTSLEGILETGAIKVTVNAMTRLNSDWLSLEEIANETNYDKNSLDFQKRVLEILIEEGMSEYDPSKKKYRLLT
ncbi:MAG: hypothetical protein ACFFCQ_11810 [Promethearchaeota archaeon]